MKESIAAIATAPGMGALGVVRVSGPALAELALRLTGKVLQPRYATLCRLRDDIGQVLDQAIVLFFPAPYSYTGEDVLELQAHGGTVSLQLLLAHVLELAKLIELPLRLARPGEFTERAFLNGKLDLIQAEAVADLIGASSQESVRSANRSLQGDFSKEIGLLTAQMVGLRTLLEANFDFPEEEIDSVYTQDLLSGVQTLQAQLATVLRKTQQGAILREGIRVVISGQPNVGKSTLLNALAGQDLAIVSDIAGTTRDRIEQTVQLFGFPLLLVDTAGLREQTERIDPIEKLGIGRSWKAIEQADLILFVRDASRFSDPKYLAEDDKIRTQFDANTPVLEVLNKVDLFDSSEIASGICGLMGSRIAPDRGVETTTAISISAKSQTGLDLLQSAIAEKVGWRSTNEGLYSARRRHVFALQSAVAYLTSAEEGMLSLNSAFDLVAEDLRLAHAELCTITGAFSSEDLLGKIFSEFCIGK